MSIYIVHCLKEPLMRWTH